MNISLSYKIASVFFVTILLLTVVSFFYFTSTQSFIESSAKVQTSQKVINQLEVVMSLIKDAETGQRGYIITKNEDFLAPYYIASQNLENDLLLLSLLLKDSIQTKRYETLVPEISSMMARLDFSIDLIRKNEFENAVSYLVNLTGKRYMERIRSTVQLMKEEEKARLNTLTQKVERSAQNTLIAVIIGSTLTSFFLILSLITIIVEIKKKRRAEANLKEANTELLSTQEHLKKAYGELELRVKDRTRALAISEERYRSLISATTSIVWTANHQGKIVERVLSWETYTGQSFDRYKNFSWMNTIHPKDKIPIIEAWGEAQKANSNFVVEARLRKNNGQYRHILLNGVPVLQSDGTVREWIGTISDIHDKKQAEEALIAKNAEVEIAYEQAEINNRKLKSVNQVMETFVYAAAHDLKSPVINLKSLLEFIDETEDVDQKMELVQRFGEALTRLHTTVIGLGEIIQIQESDNSPVKPVYFQDVLDQVKAESASEIIKKDATIKAEFEQVTNIIYLESYIKSIITNMTTNALKYAQDDVPLLLEISSKKENDTVILTFKDNGSGMDLERYGTNLFKPFKRFSTKAEGKGIGLHIIKSMIAKNGGSIEVESALDVGTTFTCYLKEYALSENKHA